MLFLSDGMSQDREQKRSRRAEKKCTFEVNDIRDIPKPLALNYLPYLLLSALGSQ